MYFALNKTDSEVLHTNSYTPNILQNLFEYLKANITISLPE